jgi:hypothetical protein
MKVAGLEIVGYSGDASSRVRGYIAMGKWLAGDWSVALESSSRNF